MYMLFFSCGIYAFNKERVELDNPMRKPHKCLVPRLPTNYCNNPYYIVIVLLDRFLHYESRPPAHFVG